MSQKRKGIRGILIGKEEIILSLFADNMILYVESPTKKLLGLINKFNKL